AREVIGVRRRRRGRWLEPAQESEPAGGVAGEPEPRQAHLPHHERPGLAVGPAVGRGLDLGWGDEFAGAVGQAQGLGNDQEVDGDAPERSPGHLQVGTVDEVTAAFLGQGAVALARQRVRALEELLEHSRTSTMRGTGDGFDYTRKAVMWRSTSRKCQNPRQEL